MVLLLALAVSASAGLVTDPLSPGDGSYRPSKFATLITRSSEYKAKM